MEYVRAKRISLKAHPHYDEKWLQSLISEDPSVLGIPGDLTLHSMERPQAGGGRLDLLLVDESVSPRIRYEVEIQLGATDPSHIIRTIEYWDLERTRYPSSEHVAVLVAEDVTSRFLNVLRLFNAAIPIMAIQLNALEVAGHLTVDATTVLDLTLRSTDEEDEPGEPVDRTYWETQTPEAMVVVDAVYGMVKEVLPNEPIELKYNKRHIGLTRHGRSDNVVAFNPRKSGKALTVFRTPRTEELTTRLEELGLDLATGFRANRTWIRLGKADLEIHRQTLLELIRTAAELPPLQDDLPSEAGPREEPPFSG